MENILVSLIIQMCSGDSNEYNVQGQAQDCHFYMINCAVGPNGEIKGQKIRDCDENKKRKVIKNSKFSE